jgi:hypothetical protein
MSGMRLIAVSPFPRSLDKLKRAALMFDQICLNQSSTSAILGSREQAELHWLKAKGVVFEQELKDVIGFSRNKNRTKVYLLPRPEGFKGAGKMTKAMLENADPALLIRSPGLSAEMIRELLSRLLALEISNFEKVEAVPLLASERAMFANVSSAKDAGKREEVIDVVLNSFPEPDDSTSWEQILDFRSDPESRAKFLGLRSWIIDMSHGAFSQHETRDKLEWALHQYSDHLNLHRIKANTGILRTLIVGGAEAIESVLKFKLKNAAELMFSARSRRLSLLEAESNAPGRELAYIYSARRRFGK